MGTAIEHPVPDHVKNVICNFWQPGTLTLGAECQSAQMSIITNNGLTRSGTGCFIAVSVWQQWVSKDYTLTWNHVKEKSWPVNSTHSREVVVLPRKVSNSSSDTSSASLSTSSGSRRRPSADSLLKYLHRQYNKRTGQGLYRPTGQCGN